MSHQIHRLFIVVSSSNVVDRNRTEKEKEERKRKKLQERERRKRREREKSEGERQTERAAQRERERRTHHTVPWRESEWTKIFCERKPEGEGRIGRHARQRETKAAEKPAEG